MSRSLSPFRVSAVDLTLRACVAGLGSCAAWRPSVPSTHRGCKPVVVPCAAKDGWDALEDLAIIEALECKHSNSYSSLLVMSLRIAPLARYVCSLCILRDALWLRPDVITDKKKGLALATAFYKKWNPKALKELLDGQSMVRLIPLRRSLAGLLYRCGFVSCMLWPASSRFLTKVGCFIRGLHSWPACICPFRLRLNFVAPNCVAEEEGGSGGEEDEEETAAKKAPKVGLQFCCLFGGGCFATAIVRHDRIV